MLNLLSPNTQSVDPLPAVPQACDDVLVASFSDPLVADYIEHAQPSDRRWHIADLTTSSASEAGPLSAVLLFLKPCLTANERQALDSFFHTIVQKQPRFIGIVSTFRVHLGDEEAAAAERFALDRLTAALKDARRGTNHQSATASEHRVRIVTFRPGHILGPHSRATVQLRRWGFCYPLVPGRQTSCFVSGAELFAAIESERRAAELGETAHQRARLLTLLGPNRPWRELLAEHRTRSFLSHGLTALCALLSLLFLGQAAALIIAWLARWKPGWNSWQVGTLRPSGFQELLSLYNRHNFRYVKIVGYNNGVVHFGHRYPGKTIVSTVLCHRVVRTAADVIKADCGATIRTARDFLAGADQELFVVPNYSYVCLGTAFFVPIHGSAADFATVAETITRVLLYDPAADRLLLVDSDEPAFREAVYNLRSDVLLLRLWLRVKPKDRYFVNRQTLENPDGDILLAALRDSQATNVEIRKANAGGDQVEISRYFKAGAGTAGPVLEIARDSLGRLWDKLEENAVSSFLMHALTRWFAWHVELFFTADEFVTFWRTHKTLPLKKIQLRYIRRDGLPHSPFRDHDCVSADMFMFRRQRGRFENYLKNTFAVIRSNPGKHSR